MNNKVKVWFQNRRMKWKRARGVAYPKASSKSKADPNEMFDSSVNNDFEDGEEFSDDEDDEEDEDECDEDAEANNNGHGVFNKNQLKHEIK
jgi:hypothetical protein